MSSRIIAVVTGDIVGSRNATASQLDRSMAALEAASRGFGSPRSLDLRFTRYRGDGWQVLLTRPALALRAMVYLRAVLKSFDTGLDTRMACGFGPMDHAGGRDLSDAAGTAFVRSGTALDGMGKAGMTMTGDGLTPLHDAVIRLLDVVVADWTAGQAEAASFVLNAGLTQQDIAARLGITRQAVQHRLAGARLADVSATLDIFETEFDKAPAP